MKRTSFIAAFLALMLLPGMAFAQVYKCKGKSGESVYSEHPCDANAQPMKLREERPATGGGFVAPPPATSENVESNEGSEPMPTAPELDRSAERECIAAATASIYGPSNDRVATYQQQMGVLNEQLASTSTAERSQALRARMATLRQAITREHGNANTLVNAARRRCVEQHRPAS